MISGVICGYYNFRSNGTRNVAIYETPSIFALMKVICIVCIVVIHALKLHKTLHNDKGPIYFCTCSFEEPQILTAPHSYIYIYTKLDFFAAHFHGEQSIRIASLYITDICWPLSHEHSGRNASTNQPTHQCVLDPIPPWELSCSSHSKISTRGDWNQSWTNQPTNQWLALAKRLVVCYLKKKADVPKWQCLRKLWLPGDETGFTTNPRTTTSSSIQMIEVLVHFSWENWPHDDYPPGVYYILLWYNLDLPPSQWQPVATDFIRSGSNPKNVKWIVMTTKIPSPPRGYTIHPWRPTFFFFRKVSRASKSSVRALPERGFHKISNHSSQSSGEVSDGESLDHLCWLVYGTPNIRKVYGGCINLWFFNRSRTSIPKRKGALHQRVSRNYGLNKGFRNHWPEPTNFFDSFRDGIFPNIAYLFRKISCHFFPGIFLTGLNFLPKQKSTKRLIHRILVWHIYQDVPSKSANYR